MGVHATKCTRRSTGGHSGTRIAFQAKNRIYQSPTSINRTSPTTLRPPVGRLEPRLPRCMPATFVHSVVSLHRPCMSSLCFQSLRPNHHRLSRPVHHAACASQACPLRDTHWQSGGVPILSVQYSMLDYSSFIHKLPSAYTPARQQPYFDLAYSSTLISCRAQELILANAPYRGPHNIGSFA